METAAADRIRERRRLSPLKWTRARQRPTVPLSTSQPRAYCHARLCCTAMPPGQERQVSEVSRSDLGASDTAGSRRSCAPVRRSRAHQPQNRARLRTFRLLSRLILFLQDISTLLRLLSASPLLRGQVVGLVSTWSLLPYLTASNGLENCDP